MLNSTQRTRANSLSKRIFGVSSRWKMLVEGQLARKMADTGVVHPDGSSLMAIEKHNGASVLVAERITEEKALARLEEWGRQLDAVEANQRRRQAVARFGSGSAA